MIIEYIAFVVAGLIIATLVKLIHLFYLEEKAATDRNNARIIKQAEDEWWKNYKLDKEKQDKENANISRQYKKNKRSNKYRRHNK
jgi:hypothetical protein